MTIEVILLRSLVAVADHGSYAAAGDSLGITQSAVTQQMHRLEAAVGCALFQKQGRTRTLNANGRRLLGYARQIVLVHDEALRAFDPLTATHETLRIGALHGIANSILPRVLRYLARYLPGVMMEVHIGRSPFLMEELKRGVLDLAITTRHDAQLTSALLHISPIVWMCSSDFVYQRHEPVPLLLSDENSLYRRIAVDALEERGIPWRQSFMSPTLLGIMAALRAGLGVTARNVELLSPDLRILGENEGLPRLDNVSYHMWSRPGTVNPLVRKVMSLLHRDRGAFAQQERP